MTSCYSFFPPKTKLVSFSDSAHTEQILKQQVLQKKIAGIKLTTFYSQANSTYHLTSIIVIKLLNYRKQATFWYFLLNVSQNFWEDIF